MPSKYSQKELRAAVQASYSIAEVCRKLGLKVAGGNYATLKQRFEDWDIDISHFRGQGWNIGLKFQPKVKKPIEEILVENSSYQPYKLKRRLLKEGLKNAICEACLRETWNQQPIPLELHHLNGVRNDNRITNIQLLCPNCHAQTDNYRGKNIRVAR